MAVIVRDYRGGFGGWMAIVRGGFGKKNGLPEKSMWMIWQIV
jgi:hypothetical protein